MVAAVVALLMCLPLPCATDFPHTNMYMKTGHLVPDTVFYQTGYDCKIMSTFKCMVDDGLLYKHLQPTYNKLLLSVYYDHCRQKPYEDYKVLIHQFFLIPNFVNQTSFGFKVCVTS
jgi:hypothetical protein